MRPSYLYLFLPLNVLYTYFVILPDDEAWRWDCRLWLPPWWTTSSTAWSPVAGPWSWAPWWWWWSMTDRLSSLVLISSESWGLSCEQIFLLIKTFQSDPTERPGCAVLCWWMNDVICINVDVDIFYSSLAYLMMKYYYCLMQYRTLDTGCCNTWDALVHSNLTLFDLSNN